MDLLDRDVDWTGSWTYGSVTQTGQVHGPRSVTQTGQAHGPMGARRRLDRCMDLQQRNVDWTGDELVPDRADEQRAVVHDSCGGRRDEMAVVVEQFLG